MTLANILAYRLINQQIASTEFRKPQEIVASLIAMQAQEYAMAKWAIGLRLPGTNDAMMEESFNKGDILRTHLMRPTWHFVAPTDIRWLLSLTAPRVMAVNAFMYRKEELDSKIFRRSNDILARTLKGKKYLTRTALQAALKKGKIAANGVRLSCLMMQAELDQVICSGPRQGKQFTYALFDERVAPAPPFDKEKALAEFTLRYFTSRGPATIQDFAYWSGLTVKDVKAGVASVQSQLLKETIEGNDYYFTSKLEKNITVAALRKDKKQTTFLLPDYDEFGMSYKDRRVIAGAHKGGTDYSHWLIIDGRIEGTWQRDVERNSIIIVTTVFTPLNKIQQKAVNDAVEKYETFLRK